ncbi:MMPL family transporter [Actinomadura welshii]|uniref:MMPL family transporter n=1 Tax=Actinomadura welshii TaxID=3103817 RepID=UPI00069387E8|nr:MMPL family transporter [Actinomadura madurae]
MRNRRENPAKGGGRRYRRWPVPVLLIAGWLVFLGAGGSYAGMLGDVVKNDNASFLPAGAEATQVAQIEPDFFGEEQTPAVVVYVRDSGITAGDRAAVAGDQRALASVEGVAGRISGPIPSADGRALQIVVPLSTTGDASQLPGAVQEIRERARSHPGLTAHVTGPGGMEGDLAGIFEGADVRLLVIATVVVFVILVLVYRSVILPAVVLTSAQLAQTLASVVVYFLAREDLIDLNGQSQGALLLICIGAATDYALLIVGRYREELRDRESAYEAIMVSVRRSAPAIIASGITVIIAMMCLLLSELSSNRGYGPVLALGILASLVATFTFLPAVLALLGRVAFWPLRPRYGSEHRLERGIWGRAAGAISRRPRTIWAGTAAVLVVPALFLPGFKASGSPMSEQFLGDKPDSVVGLDVLARHYPAGSGVPALIVGPAAAQGELARVSRAVPGVQSVTALSDRPGGPPKVVDGRVLLQATLVDAPDSSAAGDTVERLRTAAHAVDADARVGGSTAIAIDTVDAGWADLRTVIPLVLVTVLLLIMALLRAMVAPLLLMATVVLSAAAALGLSAIFFNRVFDFPATDASLPLFCVVFLIAVGVDYTIFLMARVREEAVRLGDTRQALVRGLTTTGGVITSAGVVLGVVFSLFGVLPFVPLAQIGFIIVVGILIDTFVVRALLVPAASYDLGRVIWWPSRPARRRT